MRVRNESGRRYGAVAAVGLVLALGACGSPGSEEPTSPAPSSSPPEVTPSEPEPTTSGPDDEAQILTAFEGFWGARVETQGGNPDPSLFEGYATGPQVEEDMAVALNLDQYGVVREGEPGFSDISVSVDGDRALVSSCVDFTTWVVPDAPGDAPTVNPIGVVVERIDGAWLVTDVTDARPGLTC